MQNLFNFRNNQKRVLFLVIYLTEVQSYQKILKTPWIGKYPTNAINNDTIYAFKRIGQPPYE